MFTFAALQEAHIILFEATRCLNVKHKFIKMRMSSSLQGIFFVSEDNLGQSSPSERHSENGRYLCRAITVDDVGVVAGGAPQGCAKG